MLNISAEEARQALVFLIHEGKVAVAEVDKALKRREQLLRELKSRLAALGEGGAAASARVGRTAARQWRASRPARKRAVSAATRAARQAQGHYLAAVRRLSKSARKQVKAIRAKSGVTAAIAAAKRMAK
jgi:hypothetical protein